MSLLSKLFGKSDTKNTEVTTAIEAGQENAEESSVNVLENLFVDSNPPATALVPEQISSSSLSSYLEQDFARKGFEDGNNWHSIEMLENKIKCIKSDFHYNLSLKVDQARQEVIKLEDLKIDMSGLSERLARQIDNKLNAIRSNIAELEGEMSMISINQGLVMVAVNQYRDAFLRGSESYQEEKMIASSTGLFN